MATPTAAVDTAGSPPPPSTEPLATAVPDQKVVYPVILPDVRPPAPALAPPPPAAMAPAPAPAPPPPAAMTPAPAPAPPPAPAPAPATRKRKLEDLGFHNSDYYKIRATIADLRVRFVQVAQATDFRNCDAATEILREIKVVMELSKKMRLNLGAISAPVKPSEKPPTVPVKDLPMKPPANPSIGDVKDVPVKPSVEALAGPAGPAKDEPMKPSEEPAAATMKDEPMKPSEEPSAGTVMGEPMKPAEEPSVEPVKDEATGPTPPGENNQAPKVAETALPPSNESADAPSKHDNSESAAVPVEE